MNEIWERSDRRDEDEGIFAFTAASIDPIFWQADRIGAPSAWWQHVPFAHWIVTVVRPRMLVELGTHAGVSYTAFCHAVVRAGLDTRCFAVDTWLGDEHAGAYGTAIFDELSTFHDQRYGRFSTLLRMTFDEAASRFEVNTIDLLHLDGFHTYEAVKHDFENWKSKLSSRAVVLFHDTNVHNADFGVWRLWSELRGQYPSFEFLHGHGLGVLAIGQEADPEILTLCSFSDSKRIARIRDRFAAMGEKWLSETREKMLAQEIGGRVAAATAEANERARQHLADALAWEQRAKEFEKASQENARAREQVVRRLQAARRGEFDANLRAEEAGSRAEQATARAEEWERRSHQAEIRVAQEATSRGRAEQERDALLASTAWRATRPLRSFGQRMPPGLRRVVRGGAKLSWWMVTLRLRTRLRERQRALAAFSLIEITGEPANSPIPLEIEDTISDHSEKPLLVSVPSAELRIMFISGEPGTPGHLYRVMRPIAVCGSNAAWMAVDEIPARIHEIEAAGILVLWRTPWSEYIAQAVDAARRGGARIIFDVDDLMIDPDLARMDVIDGIRTQHLTEESVRIHYNAVKRSMLMADLCVATTDELADQMRRHWMPALVLPNGFDHEMLSLARLAVRRRQKQPDDGLIRIGYAGGSKTHQRDFATCVDAVAEVLRAMPECRLVAFRSTDGETAILDVEEYPALRGLENQIEWRNFVSPQELPNEIARFDVNLAPLEVGNPFCESKSELKFFEAALVNVPTIASPTGPFRRAIRDGETGFLAATPAEWRMILWRLVESPALRKMIAKEAHRAVLWQYGPERRAEMIQSLFDMARGGSRAAKAFADGIEDRRQNLPALISIPASEIVFQSDRLTVAQITVVVPLHNYSQYVVEALDSVKKSTLDAIDLLIIDDCSTDDSLDVVLEWAKRNVSRFNRLQILKNAANSGLALTRNVGFDRADTPWVLPLDADNRLLPDCLMECLRVIRQSGAAFAYPVIRQFGDASELMGTADYDPLRLVNGNYIDAMALVSRAAWAHVGGYSHVKGGWEDFDFWCRMAERGLWGQKVSNQPLAEYRVHGTSMIKRAIADPRKLRNMMSDLQSRHRWLKLVWPLPRQSEDLIGDNKGWTPQSRDSLSRLLPILRCPASGGKLSLASDGGALISEDGLHRWPIVRGRPVLFPDMQSPVVNSDAHASNVLPASARELIESTDALVLHLSAGGSSERFENVVETEAAIFRNTDLVADSHHLPFADASFEAVIALNAFEHYRDPARVAQEIFRVLSPGGRVLIRTAFMQPLHEAPWHFYNCTRYGLEEWFKNFDLETLRVSENFHPGHSLAWLASECESVLRSRLTAAAADAFLEVPIGQMVSLWRTSEGNRAGRAWTDLASLPQDAQEGIAAGFELFGRRPYNASNGFSGGG